MKALTLEQIAVWSGGTLSQAVTGTLVGRVVIDSRGILPGDLFVALKGENHDAHSFLEEVAQAGAAAALVRAGTAVQNPALALIEVDDTLVALQKLAANYRASLGVKVVGVTGSSGKTSSKEFLAAVLSTRFRTHKTQGNLNNHIGVPLTLLSLDEEHEWAVVEMGMNHPGEIALLCQIAQPDAGVVTNVGWAHIEFFNDQCGIAEEKSSLVRSLGKTGLAVLNGDNEWLQSLQGKLHATTIYAGSSAICSCRVSEARWVDGQMEFVASIGGQSETIRVSAPGWHMAQNAALAIAFGHALGMSLAEMRDGLAGAILPKGRVAILKHGEGWILDDAYNANPDSMVAALKTVGLLPGEGAKVALLGAMGELGNWSEILHQYTGRAVVENHFQFCFCTGAASHALVDAAVLAGMSPEQARWFETREELFENYLAVAQPSDRIVVKGSRSQQMELVVDWLKKGAACSIT